ncbi:MAG: ABC transporter substrate-binding protein [Nocardioidaceae bacterium]
MTQPERTPTGMNRRRLLSLTGGVGLAAGLEAGLGACDVTTSSSGSNGSERAGGKSGTKDGPQATVKLPPSKADLPNGKVTFSWMTSGGLKSEFFKKTLTAYHREHPNVTMDYLESTWDRINESVPLGIRNGNAPDVFQKPQPVPVQVMVNEGWVAPLEEVIPDFETWKSKFPETAFIPGVHVFNGRTYSWTFTSSRSQYSELLLFDTGYLDKAGVDPRAERFTWETFRATAKKITKQGKGQYYGLMIPGEKMGSVAMNLAELAGLRGGEFDHKTGEYNYTKPELRAAIDWLMAVKEDGSIFPGAMSLNGADARSRMPQRVAAMTFDGPWAILQWEQESPEYAFSVAMPPTRRPGTMRHVGYEEGVAAPLFVYAKTKYPDIAGDIFTYMGSVDGQAVLGMLTQGIFTSEIEAANRRARRSSLVKGVAKKAGTIMDDLRRTVPLPQVRNPDVAKAILEQKAVQPTLADIVEGVATGQVKDVDQALEKLQDDSDKNLDEAIAKARKKGAKVSRDDWVFPNWDPSKDYTAADYAELKSS